MGDGEMCVELRDELFNRVRQRTLSLLPVTPADDIRVVRDDGN
jgi:hypothetical protein